VITVASIKRALPILIGVPVILVSSCKVGPNYQTPKASVAGQWMENSDGKFCYAFLKMTLKFGIQ
jgi:hypothetical protein